LGLTTYDRDGCFKCSTQRDFVLTPACLDKCLHLNLAQSFARTNFFSVQLPRECGAALMFESHLIYPLASDALLFSIVNHDEQEDASKALTNGARSGDSLIWRFSQLGRGRLPYICCVLSVWASAQADFY